MSVLDEILIHHQISFQYVLCGKPNRDSSLCERDVFPCPFGVYLVSYCCCNSCHKFSDLKPHRCIILTVLDIRSLKSILLGFSQVSTGLVPSGNFRGESVSLLFSAFSGFLDSLPPGPFLTSLQPLIFMATTPTTDSETPPAFFLWGF